MKKILSFIAVIAICQSSFCQVKVLPNGNLGIGITNPTQKLHVAGNTYLNGNLGVGVSSPTQKLHVVGNTYLNGNLGVGVSSPTQKLHVEGTTYLNGNLGVGVSSPTQKLHVVGNTYLNGNLGVGVSSPTQKLHVVGNTYLNGNLGIGVSSPTQKLHVVGNSFLDGNVGIGINSSSERLRIEGSFRISAWTDIIMDWTGKCCGSPVIYPSSDWYLQLGKSNKCIGTIYTDMLYCNTFNSLSDERIKENIRLLDNPIEKIMRISSYTYNIKAEHYPQDIPLDVKSNLTKTQIGFLAQELEKIFPELVTPPDSIDNFYSVNYIGMIPVLLAAIKEQQNMIENLQKEFEEEKETIRNSVMNELQQKVKSLEEALKSCCNTNQSKSAKEDENQSIQEFELTDPIHGNGNIEEMKVYQNTPNPFNVHTMIQCYIPQSIKKVELCVYDMHGVQLKCLPVLERGTTTIQIQAGQLSAGVYAYFLIGDGKTSDAKQMILTK